MQKEADFQLWSLDRGDMSAIQRHVESSVNTVATLWNVYMSPQCADRRLPTAVNRCSVRRLRHFHLSPSAVSSSVLVIVVVFCS